MTRKWLLNALLSLTILVTLALIITMFSAAQEGMLTLTLGDHDYSDSTLAWVIVLPILVVVTVIAVLVTIFAVLCALVLTLLAVALGLIVAAIGILMGLAPIVAFFAVPVLAVYGFIKLVQPKVKIASPALPLGT
jgi:hypothetical protein